MNSSGWPSVVRSNVVAEPAVQPLAPIPLQPLQVGSHRMKTPVPISVQRDRRLDLVPANAGDELGLDERLRCRRVGIRPRSRHVTLGDNILDVRGRDGTPEHHLRRELVEPHHAGEPVVLRENSQDVLFVADRLAAFVGSQVHRCRRVHSRRLPGPLAPAVDLDDRPLGVASLPVAMLFAALRGLLEIDAPLFGSDCRQPFGRQAHSSALEPDCQPLVRSCVRSVDCSSTFRH